jgi:FkbM family methyltransferase
MLNFLIDRLVIKRPAVRRALTRLLWQDKSSFLQLLGADIFANTIRENGYYRAEKSARSASLWRDEIPVLLNLAMLLDDGDTFIDVGANVGIYSAVLARCVRLGHSVRFYAFEANPDTFLRLTKTLEQTPVEAINLALSDHRGTLSFVDGAVSHVFTTVENASAYNLRDSVTSVPCERLDQVGIVGQSIVLKIDVEGQEKQVLSGRADYSKRGE